MTTPLIPIENYVDAYVGTWAANLNTNGFGMELDYYGGFTGAIPIPTIEDYFSYDIGMLYYDYPGASSQENDDVDGYGVRRY